MVKYWLTYKGAEGDVYLLEIFEAGFAGEATEVHGYANHRYAERKDMMQSIIASSLEIKLEADANLTLQDLYTEEEGKFKVSFKRNGQTIFHGILKPDGIWEDYVSTRWVMSMDAMDGLSIIKDLSFIKDDSGFYKGKITQFEAVKQCLKRIGYELPINVSYDIPRYFGLANDDSTLHNVLMNADRFYQEGSKKDIMDCEKVLKSVLEIYSAAIIQMNGEWWIYRPIDVKDSMLFHRYENGARTTVTWDAAMPIGSHIDQFNIFHVNANLRKSINPSTQAFRVHYKYGSVRSIGINSHIEFDASGNAEGWSINWFDGRVLRDGARGLKVIDAVYEPGITWVYNTQDINVSYGDNIKIIVSLYTARGRMVYNPDKPYYVEPTVLTYSFETYNFALTENGWQPKGTPAQRIRADYGISEREVVHTFELDNIPERADLLITIRIERVNPVSQDKGLYLKSIEVVPDAVDNRKGEYHTAQRTTRVSSVTKEDKTVSNGDSISDVFYGTLYKSDGEYTELWSRAAEEEGKPILAMMVEDALRIAPRPMYFFEGDIYGYFPFLSHIVMNNITGRYQPAKYSFDTRHNIAEFNFKEFDNVKLIEGPEYSYTKEIDYGQETKVVINP